jgi:hypothetical protein
MVRELLIMSVDFEKLKEEMDKDTNVSLLESNFPSEYLPLLAKQENHPAPSNDQKEILTTKYGAISTTAADIQSKVSYSSTNVPEYIVNSWEVLKDAKNWTGPNKEITEKLAARVAQYYQLGQAILLDGYTDGKFSKLGQNARCMALIENNRISAYKLENSLLVEGIRRENPAMIARSFYSSSKKDEKGNPIYDENGNMESVSWVMPDQKRYQALFNAKAVFSDHIPTVEEYEEYAEDVAIKDKVKPEIWDRTDKTLKNFQNRIEWDKSFWDPENYKNKKIKEGRDEFNIITHKNVKKGTDVRTKLDKPFVAGKIPEKQVPEKNIFNKIADGIKKVLPWSDKEEQEPLKSFSQDTEEDILRAHSLAEALNRRGEEENAYRKQNINLQ